MIVNPSRLEEKKVDKEKDLNTKVDDKSLIKEEKSKTKVKEISKPAPSKKGSKGKNKWYLIKSYFNMA